MDTTRNPKVAGLLSLLSPGLGELYAGKPMACFAIVFVMQAALWVVLGLWALAPPGMLTVLAGPAIMVGALIAIIRHAAITARRADASYRMQWYNRWYVYIAAAGVLGLAERGCARGANALLGTPYRIPSPAMESTLLVGDRVFVASVPRSLRAPAEGAIVVFRSVEASMPGLHLVKRVLGMPGDTLSMAHDTLYRNGRLLDEPYALHLADTPLAEGDSLLRQIRSWQLPYYAGIDTAGYRPTTHDWGPLVVPPNAFFALGDNRDNSYDSRIYGFVPFSNVEGRPRLIYFSLGSSVGLRWNRIGRRIS